MPGTLPTSVWAILAAVFFCAQAGRGAVDPRGLRLRIERYPDSPWPANVGAVEIWPSFASGGSFEISTADGKPVHFQTVWSAGGQPALVRFEIASGATAYVIHFETNATVPPGAWTAQGGVLLETRHCRPQPVNTLEQVTRLVAAAEPQGRGFVPQIFQGINPHGPSADYAAIFDGWFQIGREGVYEFATISSGPSYLQIDGRKIADWLGRHDPQGGRRGEHSGRVLLKPGPHRIDYVQVQFDGEPAAVAAWRPPGQERFDIMPPSAFLPVARFRVTEFQDPPTAPEQIYVEWANIEHCAAGDSLLVKLRLRAVGGRNYKWRFDDGAEAQGAEVQHIFVQPGLREVVVQAYAAQTCVATNALRIRVHPNWEQRESWRQGLFDEARRDLLRRDLTRLAARDLAEALDLADWVDDTELLQRLGEAMIRRQNDFKTAAYGPTFYKLGLAFQHEGDAGNRLAEQALRLALSPERVSSALVDKSRVRIADLLIHCDGEFDEADKILGGLSLGALAADAQRLARLLQGDLLLARGKVDEARKQYLSVGDILKAPATRSGISRAAVRERAAISLQTGDYEEAERTLDRLVYEAPLERLSVEVGLLRLNLCLKRKEFNRAFELCRALLHAAGDNPRRADLLLGVVESGLAAGKTAEAQSALRELLKSFPYSEAAARAKERWAAAKS